MGHLDGQRHGRVTHGQCDNVVGDRNVVERLGCGPCRCVGALKIVSLGDLLSESTATGTTTTTWPWSATEGCATHNDLRSVGKLVSGADVGPLAQTQTRCRCRRDDDAVFLING